MDCGLSEKEFWEMSIDETVRFRKSYMRRKESQRKETLAYIYVLGDLFGISNSRNHNKNAKYPAIEKVFPDYYTPEEMEELRQKKRNELSIQRFLLFVSSHNNNLGKEDK